MITTVWPQAITQTCAGHLLRNSFRYVGRQHWQDIAKALKTVYTARPKPLPSNGSPSRRGLGDRYPAIVRLWDNAWAEFVPFLSFDP